MVIEYWPDDLTSTAVGRKKNIPLRSPEVRVCVSVCASDHHQSARYRSSVSYKVNAQLCVYYL